MAVVEAIVKYERCRSSKGVPFVAFAFSEEILDESWGEHEIVRHVIEAMQERAEQAHPGTPMLRMPSTDPAAYELIERERQPSWLWSPGSQTEVVEYVLVDV